MTAVRQLKQRTTSPKARSIARRQRTHVPMAVPVQRKYILDFLHAMSVELSDLAQKNGLDALAVIYDMARETAESDDAKAEEGLQRR